MAAPPLGLARRVAGAGAISLAAAWSSSSSRRLRPRLLPSTRWSGVVRMGAVVGGEQEGEDEEVKLAKEMAAARRRWETLIREQKIKTLTPREAGYTFKLTDKVLLDVRPSNERQKAWVKGSTWIPVFDVDTSFDLGSVGKKVTNFVMDHWPLVSNFTVLVSKIYSGYKEDWKQLKRRTLSEKVRNLSSLLVLVGFRNFSAGRISNVHRLRKKGWAIV
ncbi:hypothetical protein E2562_036504 [Oryza meyeriana var. granulata]|uniref:Rhodanese domain-containing protein n=1 Tax=Oryza meyeriana var. granulata TaxID=110450 RepID=A0A6G1FGE9_9ORYZ|nr:hypothetical protein E2562_036504 [Oryza meyeriana var. granulata]